MTTLTIILLYLLITCSMHIGAIKAMSTINFKDWRMWVNMLIAPIAVPCNLGMLLFYLTNVMGRRYDEERTNSKKERVKKVLDDLFNNLSKNEKQNQEAQGYPTDDMFDTLRKKIKADDDIPH